MPIEGPSLQTRALDAVRSGDDTAQRAVIDSILSEGVTAAEYTTTQAALRGLKSHAESICSRIERHSERAKELSNSGRPNDAAELQREIASDTELLNELQSFTMKLSTETTLGRGATKLREALFEAATSAAQGLQGAAAALRAHSGAKPPN